MGSGWIDALAGAMHGFWGVGMYKDEEKDVAKVTISGLEDRNLAVLDKGATDTLSATSTAGYGNSQLVWASNTAVGARQNVPYQMANGNIYFPSGGYAATGNTIYPPTWYAAEGEWAASDNQEAAGQGWMLSIGPYNSPLLLAVGFGTKTEMTDEQLQQDVVEQALGGCEIAIKILAVLTKNRSVYAKWAKLSESLEKSA